MRRPAFENVALWHERDISHSSVERVILPDSTTLVDYLLHKTTEFDRNDVRVPGAHESESGEHAWIDFQRAVAARSGGERGFARGRLPGCAGSCDAGVEGRAGLPPIRAGGIKRSRKGAAKQIEHAFDLQRQLKNVDKIFARVFGEEKIGSGKKKRSTTQGSKAHQGVEALSDTGAGASPGPALENSVKSSEF